MSKRHRTGKTRYRKLLAAFALTVVMVSAGAAGAHDPYSDADANYVKVADTFLYPVGAVLEWTVFRPLHAVFGSGRPSDIESRDARAGSLKIVRGCRGPRPPRYCTERP